jgi:hypothetical protein
MARRVLASPGRARNGELSRFVEEAVQARMLELDADQAKQHNAAASPGTVRAIVDDALEWARRA